MKVGFIEAKIKREKQVVFVIFSPPPPPPIFFPSEFGIVVVEGRKALYKGFHLS